MWSEQFPEPLPVGDQSQSEEENRTVTEDLKNTYDICCSTARLRARDAAWYTHIHSAWICGTAGFPWPEAGSVRKGETIKCDWAPPPGTGLCRDQSDPASRQTIEGQMNGNKNTQHC